MQLNTNYSMWAYGDEQENAAVSTAGAATGSAAIYANREDTWNTYDNNGDVSTTVDSITDQNGNTSCISLKSCPSPRSAWSVPAVRPVVMNRITTDLEELEVTPTPIPVKRRMSAPVVSPTPLKQRMSEPVVTKQSSINADQVLGTMIKPAKEYKMSKNKYMNGSYSGELKTSVFYGRVSEHSSMPFRYDHLSVLDILKHVTCGGVLCDSYYESFLEYIVSALKEKYGGVDMYKEKISMIDGGVYEREMPMVAWSEYCYVGKLCLDWVLCNPEKLGRG